MAKQEKLFNPTPDQQFGGKQITNTIFQINQAVARELGRHEEANPYIIDGISYKEGALPPKYVDQVLALDTGYIGREIMAAMPTGAVAQLNRHLGLRGILPVYGVKIAGDARLSHFAVSGLVSKDKGHTQPAVSLSTASQMKVPDHLSPNSQDPTIYSNVTMVLADAYHRTTSLLGEAPQGSRGHNAIDGQHNPGLHKLLVQAIKTVDGKVDDPAHMLHGLHQLHQEDTDVINALRVYFRDLSSQRPMAPVSVVSIGPDNAHTGNTSIQFPFHLLNPDLTFLNVAQIAPLSSVMSEFVTAGTRPPANPDEAMKSLDKAAGGDLGTIL